MFAAPDQITKRRASGRDDLFSLLYVAFKFIKGKLPWEKAIERAARKQIKMNEQSFVKMRYLERKTFDQQMIEECSHLRPLFKYLIENRETEKKTHKDEPIDYSELVSLLQERCKGLKKPLLQK